MGAVLAVVGIFGIVIALAGSSRRRASGGGDTAPAVPSARGRRALPEPDAQTVAEVQRVLEAPGNSDTRQANVPPVNRDEVDAPRNPAAPPPAMPPPPFTGPVPGSWNLVKARNQAQSLADHVRSTGRRYDRERMKIFQRDSGLAPDGLYGPQARAALIYFGARNAPAALFPGTRTTYTPPA